MRAGAPWHSASRPGHSMTATPSSHCFPCVRERRVVADKGFEADVFRAWLHAHRTRCCISPIRGRQPARFHRGYYRCCHQIENLFCRINIHLQISTRTENLAEPFLGFVYSQPSLIGPLNDFKNTP